MDPATAIGVVSGILTFTSAAGKILKLSWNIYHSIDGSSEETQMRLQLAESMSTISNRIISSNQASLAVEDRALLALADDCDKLANDMAKELHVLGAKKRKSIAHSSITAFKTRLLRSKLNSIEKKLQYCRSQLHFHIAVLSRENTDTLLTITKNDTHKIARVERSISQLSEAIQELRINDTEHTNNQALSQLEVLLRMGRETINKFVQDRILRGIKAGFEDMSYRYQIVDNPFQDTFDWIWAFDDATLDATKFTKWLSSGNGIFHICGKLGSGKSTFMKHLYKHEKTKAELDKWMHAQGGQKLIMANFFFYALGSNPRQKSLMGLYRTLLYQILSENTNLIRATFPNHWNKALSSLEVLDDDITQAYRLLSSQKHCDTLDSCFFSFFIDGLDEYEATVSIDRREMVETLLKLSSHPSGRFKICVSSRIENPFMDLFSEQNRLYLSDLTSSDMEKYVHGKLEQVGTEVQRWQIASSITKKAEGVFLWVVLVVRNIRQQSDNGVKFSRLMREVDLLPTELDGLFHGIIDTLGTDDRQLLGQTASLLSFVGTIPEAKSMELCLTLSDYSFLEYFATDDHFAEDLQFPNLDMETVAESEARAGRRLRGACRGLVEADKDKNIDFIHRSVADFFAQGQVRIYMDNTTFPNIEALSQLKLASIKHYWWDKLDQPVTMRAFGDFDDERPMEDEMLHNHAILVACLIRHRRTQNLDICPFTFLQSLESIPQLSMKKIKNYASKCEKTAFRIHIPEYSNVTGLDYVEYEICHSSRVGHMFWAEDFTAGRKKPALDESSNGEDSMVTWRDADENVDFITSYSIPIISPLLGELCSGRLEYPILMMLQNQFKPLELDKLITLVYCAMGLTIGRVIWHRRTGSPALEGDYYPDISHEMGLVFLKSLFTQGIVSPNLLTELSFGGEFGFIRIAAGTQQLTIWQHFLSWWITAATESGDFLPDSHTQFDDKFPCKHCSHEKEEVCNREPQSFNSSTEQTPAALLLKIFIDAGADLQLLVQIKNNEDVRTGSDDSWYTYALQIFASGKDTLTIDVVININTRMEVGQYPYRAPRERIQWHDEASATIPTSALSVRDWIARSRLPNKVDLLQLIDERLSTPQ